VSSLKITKLQLENVKSYVNETITFHDGINFICGINGAGKTTLIESIGYALFDAQPGKLVDFVRYGAKRGMITVEFEGNDQRLYRVVRKFGNVNSWLVFDVESGCEIDLHGEQDVKSWLKDCMGIPQDENLSGLFNDVIGVSQGTFTAPFLTTPAGRRQIFNKLLKVESYRQAWENTRGVVSYINEIIAQEEKQQAVLQERIREYDTVKEQVENLVRVIEELQNEIQSKREIFHQNMKQRDYLRDIKAKLEATLKQVEITQLSIQNIHEIIEKLEQQLASALKAVEKVNQSREGYRLFIASSKILEELEERRKIRDRLNKTLTEKENDLTALITQINAEKESILQQKQENEDALTQKRKLMEENIDEIEKARDKLNQVNHIQQKVKTVGVLLEKYNDAVRQINGLKDRISDGYQKWTVQVEALQQLEERLKREPEIRKELEEALRFANELEKYKTEQAVLQQKIQMLTENVEKTKDGLCPFLGMECKNIDGDLTAYFHAQIDEIHLKIRENTANILRLEQVVQKCDTLRKKLSEIDADKKIAEEKNKEKLQYIKAFKHYFTQILNINPCKTAEEFKNEYALLTESLDCFQGVVQHADFFKEFQESMEEILLTWQNYDACVAVFSEQSYSQLEELVSWVTVLCEKFGENIQFVKELYEKTCNILRNEEQKCSTLFAQLTKRQELIEEEQKLLREKIKMLDERSRKLLSKEKQVQVLENEKSSIAQQLRQYENIDMLIHEQKSLQKLNQETYNEFIKYQEEAGKVEHLQKDLELRKSEIRTKQVQLTNLTEEVETLQHQFHSEELESYEQKVVELQKEIAVMEKDMEERQRNLQEYNERLAEMEAAKKEIENIQTKIEKYIGIRSMMEYIRSVFNRAGEKVGAVYREYLAKEADNLYREVSKENVCLEWQDDYEIVLLDQINNKNRRRVFRQLSGGEQMTAALAVRLSLLKQLSNTKLGFFDEPTGNLDSERRNNLARIIPEITGGFDQLFIISHDDSFDSITENVIQLKKDQGDGTKIV